jgi:hypothetical protein
MYESYRTGGAPVSVDLLWRVARRPRDEYTFELATSSGGLFAHETAIFASKFIISVANSNLAAEHLLGWF